MYKVEPAVRILQLPNECGASFNLNLRSLNVLVFVSSLIYTGLPDHTGQELGHDTSGFECLSAFR